MNPTIDLNECLERVVDWAKEVGKIHLHYFRGNNLNIETKSSSHDLLTVADKESEAYIISRIKEYYPDHQIMAEESGSNELVSDYCWVIDPVDGTTNFAQGIPVFAVSIALQYKGESVVGVVLAPFLNELFTAVKGQGAFLNGQLIHVSQKPDLNSSLVCTGFPYDHGTNPDNNTDNVARVLPHCRDIRRMGAASYDLCCVGAGFFDGFWEFDLKAWDLAAAQIVIEEAGGIVYHFRSGRNISIIAGNAAIVAQLKAYVC